MPGVLTRWDPYGEIAEMRSRLDRMFEEMSSGGGWKWMPAINVERSERNLVMRADVPGFKPGEISIEVEDEMLTISGKHEEAKEEMGKHFLGHERHFGSFSRTIALPAGVTHDGVLEVKVPLPEEKTESKKVTITAEAA